MAKLKEFWQGVFHRRRKDVTQPIEVEIIETPVIVSREEMSVTTRPISGPQEELFLPISYKHRTEDEKLSLDGYELPGITYRVHTSATQPSVLPDAPANFGGQVYNMEQFKIGLNDGYAGMSPVHNIKNLVNTQEIEKALSYPLRPNERIAAAEAKKVWLDLAIEQRKDELEKLDQKEQALRPRLDSLLEQRDKRVKDEIEFENQQIENSRQEKQADKESIETLDENTEEANHQNMFVKLITGLFLTLCGVIFMIADIALSIAAIYALGFQDVGGIKWGETIFNPTYWKTHWEGVSICLGIAAITMFFKYAYDRLVHSPTPFKRVEAIIFSVISVICVTTVCFLGVLRADYLLKNMSVAAQETVQSNTATAPEASAPTRSTAQPQTQGNQDDFLGVSKTVAFATMFLTTMLFPILGAIALSEGLSRTFGGLGLILQETAKPFSRLTEKVSTAMQQSGPATLEREINTTEAQISQVDDKRSLIRQELNAAERQKQLVDRLIPVWQNALAAYDNRWQAIKQLERLLYIHGYEQGRILRGSQGAYKIISGILANELTLRSATATIEASNGKTNGEEQHMMTKRE